MAHRFLEGLSPKCQNVHGHNEIIKATITPRSKDKPLDGRFNMVAEFSQVKKDWHQWIDDSIDHSTILNEKDPLVEWLQKSLPSPRLMLTPGDPTTEMMAALFCAKLNAFLEPIELVCSQLELIETPTNSVIFEGQPSDHLPPRENPWWYRPDPSTY